MTFGERVRIRRKELHMTQQELADEIGISKMSVRRIEAGGHVGLSIGEAIAALLQIPLGGRFDQDDQRQRLDAAFDKLNSTGQQEAVKRVEELTEIPRYQADNIRNVPLVKDIIVKR